MRISDWSSDVCSSDLLDDRLQPVPDNPETDAAEQRHLGKRFDEFDQSLNSENAFEPAQRIELSRFGPESVGTKAKRRQHGIRGNVCGQLRNPDAADGHRGNAQKVRGPRDWHKNENVLRVETS